MIGECKLCLTKKDLRLSHSIPKSFFKRAKENGKLVLIQDGKKTIHGSFDPKEYMLCQDCEVFIEKNYEAYGTTVLRNHKKITKYEDHLILASFKYEKFYLYLLSILWRASLSTHNHYESVFCSEVLESLLRHCISNKKIEINSSGVRLDYFIRICVFRIIDSTGTIPEEIIRSLLSNFSQVAETNKEAVYWYWIVDGFIIFYYLSVENDEHSIRFTRLKSQLVKGSHQKIIKLDIKTDKVLLNVFSHLILKE
ncbi:hypothetical protein [Rouxiella silvae]|uniref:hypothetical protein n=1 Tax=Rouxiella silvae TaxID=1646373 RepID=UPI0039EE6512